MCVAFGAAYIWLSVSINAGNTAHTVLLLFPGRHMATASSRPAEWVINSLQVGRLWLLIQRKETRHLRLYLNFLRSQNRLSNRPVISPGGPVLSLTSYGRRIQSVYLAIESIAAASYLPSRLILWLDDSKTFYNLPETIKRLQARGLEVKLTENLGPHTKYYPTLGIMGDLDEPLVICDDDQLYTRKWLEKLMKAFRENPEIVSCYRAHVVRLLEDRIAPYTKWRSCASDKPSMLHFATGVSGIVLPPRLLRALRERGTEFKALCPAADDIWLHVNAIRAGMRTRQIGSWQRNFPIIPGTQTQRLMDANVSGSQNDVQIARTYNAQDIALLQREATWSAAVQVV